MIEPQTPVVKIGTVIWNVTGLVGTTGETDINAKLGTVLSISKNQVKIQVNKQKQITCAFAEIERFIGV